MSFSENTSDSEWKAARMKVQRTIKQSSKSDKEPKEQKSPTSRSLKPKYNQKFCEKWLKIFHPWLRRAAEDPNKPFCRACQSTMDCNRCHLVRHERTTKHKRNLEALLTNGEGAALQEFRIRKQRSKYYCRKLEVQQEDKVDKEIQLENRDSVPPTKTLEEPLPMVAIADPISSAPSIEHVTVPKQEHPCETESATKVTESSYSLPKRSDSSNQEGLKLLLQIHQDKNELMDSFRELMGSQRTPNHTPPPKEKNHVDLFFESVRSSVKALSPKLVAEAKMRVSQLICELELRGLKENNAQEAMNPHPLANLPRPSGHGGQAVAQQPGSSRIG
ncbi:protein suppressor of variegation 3-7 [Drosophila takahashii]|uniref:protein suppressor of variegation 3-7 n=1 Tax=Drosophila takahashii TaxID=29030 RepID=UPI001CF89A6B|nr:protein suppressor of variegation 3-7 [Drosophila takahashii]